VKEISGVAIKGFQEGHYDEVDLIFTRYQSAMNTRPTTMKLLPLEKSEVLRTGDGIKGEPLFEPDPEEIMSLLLPKYLEAQIYNGLVESVASEQGARMVSMKSATENAEEMISSLTLSFNKAARLRSQRTLGDHRRRGCEVCEEKNEYAIRIRNHL
jgi:F-type H+-transporting ATPase subunit gamma